MSDVKLRPDLGEFVYEYKCTCGKKVLLYNKGKAEKLIKCFDCQDQAVFSGDKITVIGGEK